MLGMYVHTHWSYNHPYAARSWTLEDWRGYLSGLKTLGYDLVMIWPLLDLMPEHLTPSDEAFLGKLGQVIDHAHTALGMKVAIVIGANIIGNERAAEYTFEDRPYFICEHRTDVRDAAERRRLLEARRRCFGYLRAMDYLVMIDSDPGGMPGSTNAEFVELMRDQLHMARELNPAIEMVYWMWVGWENYNRFWDDCAKWREGDAEIELHWDEKSFVETLELMRTRIAEPWSLFACMELHSKIVAQAGLEQRVLYFPYGAVEGEPTFPMTNHQPGFIGECLAPLATHHYPGGTMCNAQTHCLQLPGTYQFAHLARGGSAESLDLAAFGETLLVGLGGVLSRAWRLMAAEDVQALRAAAAEVRAASGKTWPLGPAAGLLFGDPARFLEDLADNLSVRAALLEFRAAATAARGACDEKGTPTGAVDTAALKAAIRALLPRFEPYQRKLGYGDAYGVCPLYQWLNDLVKDLGDPAIDKALREFNDWRDPLVRNGVLDRLLAALRDYSRA